MNAGGKTNKNFLILKGHLWSKCAFLGLPTHLKVL